MTVSVAAGGLDLPLVALGARLDEAVRELVGDAFASAERQVMFMRAGDCAQEAPGCLRVLVLESDAPTLGPASQRWLSMVWKRLPGFARDRQRGRVRVVPYADVAQAMQTCRVRLDVKAIAAGLPLRELPAGTRESLRRCARALTGKRVAIALGGAGAWGLAGAVLIQELEKRGVPIDIIAGSSSGALIGAYYCVGGSEGIARLIKRGPELASTMWMMSFTSAIAEVGVDEELLGARLEALEIPLLPIVSNLTMRRPEVVVEGSAGLGVRASVCAPGVFAPTLIGDQVYVDGAVTDNHPTGIVESLGAALVISGNLLPAARLRAGQHESSTFWGRVAGDLHPLSRMNDVAAALALFVHAASAPEPSPHRITYEPEAVSAPLLHTFEYNKAAAIVAHAQQDPLLHATADAAERAWRGLVQGTGSI